MKKLYTTILTTSLLAAFSANGATIINSTSAPAAGDFASDSVNALDGVESENQLRVRNVLESAGQSFTLGTTGDADYQLNSITLLASGTDGSATESTEGLIIRLYEGTPTDAGTSINYGGVAATPFYEFTFGAGSFDTTTGSYITFEFDAAEIAAIGDLTAGVEYAFSVGVDTSVETTDIDFRFVRDEDNGYAGGTSFLNGNRVLNGVTPEALNSDLVFVVNATAVPEPSSTLLSGLGALALLARRRRK